MLRLRQAFSEFMAMSPLEVAVIRATAPTPKAIEFSYIASTVYCKYQEDLAMLFLRTRLAASNWFVLALSIWFTC
jgi:hypothetical protein